MLGVARLHLQGRVFHIGPLAHGAIVVLGLAVAEELQDHHTVRRTDAALSIGEDVLVRSNALLRKDPPNLFR